MCISCDDSAVCCLLDDDENKTEECGDCSNADWDNFDPEQCEPIERFWFRRSGGGDTVNALNKAVHDNPDLAAGVGTGIGAALASGGDDDDDDDDSGDDAGDDEGDDDEGDDDEGDDDDDDERRFWFGSGSSDDATKSGP
jgi:hypothetical protein